MLLEAADKSPPLGAFSRGGFTTIGVEVFFSLKDFSPLVRTGLTSLLSDFEAVLPKDPVDPLVDLVEVAGALAEAVELDLRDMWKWGAEICPDGYIRVGAISEPSIRGEFKIFR